MKDDLVKIERKFKSVIRDHYEDTQIDFPNDDFKFQNAVNNIKFEEGTLYTELCDMFIAGIKYGENLEKYKRVKQLNKVICKAEYLCEQNEIARKQGEITRKRNVLLISG